MAVLSRAKAVRLKCMDCCCQQQVEVRLCNAVNCPLHPYRMGSPRATDKANQLLGIELPYEIDLDGKTSEDDECLEEDEE